MNKRYVLLDCGPMNVAIDFTAMVIFINHFANTSALMAKQISFNDISHGTGLQIEGYIIIIRDMKVLCINGPDMAYERKIK